MRDLLPFRFAHEISSYYCAISVYIITGVIRLVVILAVGLPLVDRVLVRVVLKVAGVVVDLDLTCGAAEVFGLIAPVVADFVIPPEKCLPEAFIVLNSLKLHISKSPHLHLTRGMVQYPAFSSD